MATVSKKQAKKVVKKVKKNKFLGFLILVAIVVVGVLGYLSYSKLSKLSAKFEETDINLDSIPSEVSSPVDFKLPTIEGVEFSYVVDKALVGI